MTTTPKPLPEAESVVYVRLPRWGKGGVVGPYFGPAQIMARTRIVNQHEVLMSSERNERHEDAPAWRYGWAWVRLLNMDNHPCIVRFDEIVETTKGVAGGAA